MRKIFRLNKGHALYVSPFLPEKFRDLQSIPYEVLDVRYDEETDTLTLKIKLHIEKEEDEDDEYGESGV